MSLLSQSCAEATRWLSESQDHALPRSARIGLQFHLAICRHCRRYRRQLEQMRSAFKAYPGQLAAERLPDEFRRELVQMLENQSH